MRPLMAGLCVLGLWGSVVPPAGAAWNNVFQPTLFERFCRPRTSNYYTPPAVVHSSPVATVAALPAAPCNTCAPCPQPACSTSYVQRCYYQPVTSYTTQTYYEPVTTYRTSYYYEPVTSYRYSCYYDPCSCSYQQVATPVTSYQLRAQNCPVQSWVQRCAQVPVTTYQKSCYWQPQTTCCQTTTGALIPADGAVPMVAPTNPPPNITPTNPPPSLNEQRTPGTGTPGTGSPLYDKSYYPQPQPMGVPNAAWKPALGLPAFPTTAPVPPPPVKLDRIVVGPDATVEGQVVRSDNTPRPNAKVDFVSSQHPAARQSVTANSAGRFQVSLASGSWNVYLQGPDGATIFHSRIDVQDSQTARLTLVNR